MDAMQEAGHEPREDDALQCGHMDVILGEHIHDAAQHQLPCLLVLCLTVHFTLLVAGHPLCAWLPGWLLDWLEAAVDAPCVPLSKAPLMSAMQRQFFT